jgi:hypothetical protein
MLTGWCSSTYADARGAVREDVVIDIWPIVPRGPGHHGLAGLG